MKTKILMVCLGNICRSPLAEGILASKLDPTKFMVDSAGTAGYHVGELADRRSIATAKQYGIDITYQRSRKFVRSDFQTFEYIFAMDQSNYNNILSLAKTAEDRSKVHLMLNQISPNSNAEVPDPYYGGDQGFENVFQMLDEACSIFAAKLSKS
ncbi:low molecular weight phosphotyrosine protein phosphatase [Kordia sp. YSTF-M3]|uniref:protein-tyrosine-phosphatase n=1 Tax=Kordia aestuariivivens TaxID=2759037 RepID=A0ABR7QCA9_9FLAO|nr:low molecular weight protein-tyrosine-phosphatase [Kordia aestuariivivens]MBC8756118.1 low molecular weight phosphotyrosine protein phosphatase [Kordia aestuariivivens]